MSEKRKLDQILKQIEERNQEIEKLQKEIEAKEGIISDQMSFIEKYREDNPADAFLAEVFGSLLSKGDKLYSTSTGLHDMSVEEIVDSFITLYDEAKMNKRAGSQTRRVDMFISKYSETVSHIKQKRMNPEKFEIVKQIGKGTFADVFLAAFKEDSKRRPYCIKRMLKSKIQSEAAHVWPDVELEVMVKLSRNKSPGTVNLHSAFHDHSYLYFAMDYYIGGDMLCMLDRKEVFSESWALFYFAEMAVAVKSVHELGFVHRDLKIENFLLDRSGHVILIDFGSACPMVNGQCSQNIYITSEYMSPELVRILRGESVTYGPGADWWSLGVILFEMLYGDTPFIGDDLGTVMPTNRIVNHKEEFAFPDDIEVSQSVKSLVLGLIEDEDKRFGFEDIQKHKVYENVIWENLMSNLKNLNSAKKAGMNVPFKPEVVGNFDTTFFDEFDDEDVDEYATSITKKSHSVNRSTSQVYSNYSFGDLLPYVGFSYQRGDDKKLQQRTTLRKKHKGALPTTPLDGIAKKNRVRFCDKAVFFESVRIEDLVTVKRMLSEKKVKITDTTDSFTQTALHVACIYGNEKIVKFLVEKGSDVNKQDDFFCTSLHCTLASEEPDSAAIALYLLKNGARVDLQDLEGCLPIDLTKNQEIINAINAKTRK